jgi:hypothetical protein
MAFLIVYAKMVTQELIAKLVSCSFIKYLVNKILKFSNNKDVGGCYSSPCYNGATCNAQSSLGYTCTCASMFISKFYRKI